MSNIRIGEVIKNLRNEQNRKQDELAEYLNVSTQAISKWENANAYPDITLIPNIAEFFSVSIETLFSCSQKMPDNVYQENCLVQNNLLKVGNIDMTISLWKEAFNKYSNDYRVLKEYMNAMCLKRDNRYTDKIIDYAVCIFKNCKDDDIIQNTEFILKAYLYNEFDKEHNNFNYDHLKHIEEPPLNQYETDIIFNKFKKCANIVITNKEVIKVLIVDDAPFMRNILKKILQGVKECECIEACNGYEAERLAQEYEPDLIILDINMPECNGIVALKQIRKTNPLVKIVMCSAMSYNAIVMEAAKAGANEFVVKPFQAEKLIETVF